MACPNDDPRLSLDIAGVKFKHPFFLASGPTTHAADQLARGCEEGWAGASIKLTFDPAPYINREPRYIYFDPNGLFAFTAEKRINLDQALQLVQDSLPRVSPDFVIMANYSYVGDKGLEGWINMARSFAQAGCQVLELNLGCPNMSFNVSLSGGEHHDGPKSGASLGMIPEAVYEVTKATVEAVSIPVFVKLSPEGSKIGESSQAAYRAGAVAVGSNSNRLAIMPVDVWNPKKSIIHLQEQVSLTCTSGPWAKPLALRDLYEIRKRNGPNVRVIATGGCETWQDAVEMAFYGADLVGICTAVLVHGFGIVKPIKEGLLQYLDKMGYESWEAMRDLLVNEVQSAETLTLYPGHARIKDTGLAAPCKFTCPNQVPAQGYVRKVAERDFAGAYRLITSRDPLQSVCGYVCAHPCETACTRGDLDDPIRIRDIKRFVLAYAEKQGWKPEVDRLPATGKKVAVIGAGPASLTCAWDLARAGHQVTVFEAAKQPGGMLRYGIPAFRLPEAALDKELAALARLGVTFECEKALGRDITIADLEAQSFEAVFVGIGAQAGRKLDVPGEDAAGVTAAADWLCQVRETGTAPVGKRVAVVGGGFTAVDAARTAVRLGAKEVFLCYRRTRDEMPAVPEEVWEAEEEGVRVIYLVAPTEVVTEGGKVTGLRMIINTLGAPDASGRRRPDPVQEADFTLPCDMIIGALGQLVAGAVEGVAQRRDGSFECDAETGATSVPGLFVGGDAAAGADSIIAAIASGRRAAVSIDRYLMGGNAYLEYDPELTESSRQAVIVRSRDEERQLRVPLVLRAPDQRKADFELYAPVMSEAEAVAEASRCLSCGCGSGCGLCARICSNFAINPDRPDTFCVDEEKCVACGMCYRRCPNQNMEMVQLPGTV